MNKLRKAAEEAFKAQLTCNKTEGYIYWQTVLLNYDSESFRCFEAGYIAALAQSEAEPVLERKGFKPTVYGEDEDGRRVLNRCSNKYEQKIVSDLVDEAFIAPTYLDVPASPQYIARDLLSEEVLEDEMIDGDTPIYITDKPLYTHQSNIYPMSADKVEELQDFAIWMTGCGYDFTQHKFFRDKRYLFTLSKDDAAALITYYRSKDD